MSERACYTLVCLLCLLDMLSGVLVQSSARARAEAKAVLLLQQQQRLTEPEANIGLARLERARSTRSHCRAIATCTLISS